MINRKELEQIFHKHGYTDFKWINTESIVVSYWVRFKCMFGCMTYGKKGSCPPNVPSVPECQEFFKEYRDAVVFHFEKMFEKPEDRHQWSRKVNNKLLKLERDVFLAGYHKAFLLFMDECWLCQECPGIRIECKNKKASRPSPESLAVNVFATVRSCGYPIEVLNNYHQTMNRYSFLLIE